MFTFNTGLFKNNTENTNSENVSFKSIHIQCLVFFLLSYTKSHNVAYVNDIYISQSYGIRLNYMS